MTVPAPLPALGVPGVYLAPEVERRVPALARMDVCAFVGVAPRGPAWERTTDPFFTNPATGHRVRSVAVPVQSWAEYEATFGGFTGPGLLPYAVSAFFAAGGRRAYVVRIVPATDPPNPEPVACARLTFGPQVHDGLRGRVSLRARNEGTWGARLRATLRFVPSPIGAPRVDSGALVLPPGPSVGAGTLLRLFPVDGPSVLRQVTAVERRPAISGVGWHRVAIVDLQLSGPLSRAETISGELEVVDTDPGRPRVERFSDLGLLDVHARWLGRVLATESTLVELPDAMTAVLPSGPAMTSATARPRTDEQGIDRYRAITAADLFGGDLDDPLAPPAGLDALRDLPDVATVVVPDLFAPAPPTPLENVTLPPPSPAGAAFAPCVVPANPPEPTERSELSDVELAGLRLDPELPKERTELTARQLRLVDFAQRHQLVALLDVPPGLRLTDVLAWRAAFDSPYAAAYHGWPRVPDPRADRLLTVPPTGYAAGVLAAVEAARGLPYGPAQVLLPDVVTVTDDTIDPAALHRAGINALVLDRDGVRITAARTLARDRAWRQLTARRIVTAVERTLLRELAWATFEPLDGRLADRVAMTAGYLLSELYAAGAFAGETPQRSYFVRAPVLGAGVRAESTLLGEIGLAPSAPMEFLVLRLLRADDGTIGVEVRRE